ncbi:type III effector [Herbaspirillum huttiense]|uniref:Type III effector n=2 Tax=Herbaspirillum huttiense TaxID=863372 RepID=A0AAJ2H925_9BURK|nr:type III effector [Herbaspirillum huttiense]MDR9837803.1 type III effector [Herbaspirillum huttiense]
MGNYFCVGGSSGTHEVSSPAHQESDVATQILQQRNALQNSAGLPQDQYQFVMYRAPGGIRDRYNRLYRETTATLQIADMHHAYLTGASTVHSGHRVENILSELNSRIEAWADMREALVTAMENEVEPYREVINPSGSRRIGFQTF